MLEYGGRSVVGSGERRNLFAFESACRIQEANHRAAFFDDSRVGGCFSLAIKKVTQLHEQSDLLRVRLFVLLTIESECRKAFGLRDGKIVERGFNLTVVLGCHWPQGSHQRRKSACKHLKALEATLGRAWGRWYGR